MCPADDLGARAPVGRLDELGSVAAGLNDMLERMEHFNVELQQRIQAATGELRERNVELEDSYRRVLVLRDALARAERMAAVGQMAANVAHQVGTPLNLISGYVQMVREGNADPRTRERLEIVERQIQQVTRVLRSMLDHARQRSPREVVDLGHIVEYACETAQSQLSFAGIRLSLRLERDLPRIEADATELELVVLNLIKNSMDAMPLWRHAHHYRERDRERRANGGCRHRKRHSARDAGARVRTVGHHEDGGPGHRPWPGHRARSDRGARRNHHGHNTEARRPQS